MRHDRGVRLALTALFFVLAAGCGGEGDDPLDAAAPFDAFVLDAPSLDAPMPDAPAEDDAAAADAAADDAATDDAGAEDAGDDAGGGAAGDPCGSQDDCGAGLSCCYPCGIPGCQNVCEPTCDEGEPACVGGCFLRP